MWCNILLSWQVVKLEEVDNNSMCKVKKKVTERDKGSTHDKERREKKSEIAVKHWRRQVSNSDLLHWWKSIG